jgi:hypothetical protein
MADEIEAAALAMAKLIARRHLNREPTEKDIQYWMFEARYEEAKAVLAAADTARLKDDEAFDAPTKIARDIVEQFVWPSNVMLRGKLVGQQYAVAELIAEAIDAERNCIFAQAARIEALEQMLANERVAQVRGSRDAPGFEACVHAEIESIRATLEGR